MLSTRLDYICDINNSCGEKIMSKSKLYVWLLAVLGFQMQSCRAFEEEEYGCPYTRFKTNGFVQDENGNKIQGAEVSVRIESIESDPNRNEEKANGTAISDKNGNYQVVDGRCDGISHYEQLQYEIITKKDGYKPDTILKEIKKEELKLKKEGTWEKSTEQKIDIVLKKR